MTFGLASAAFGMFSLPVRFANTEIFGQINDILTMVNGG